MSARFPLPIVLALAACSAAPTGPAAVAQAPDLASRPTQAPDAPPACAGATAPYVVEGVVRWADGAPAEGLPVGLGAEGGGALQERARTGPDGRYRVELTEAGLFGVLGAPAARPATCVRAPLLTETATEDFVVARSCPVVTVVRGPRATPVAGARVSWVVRQGETLFRGEAEGASDAEGRLRLDGLPCGEVALRVERGGLAQSRSDAGVPGGLRAPCRAGDVDTVRTCFELAAPSDPPPEVGVEMGPAVALRGRVTELGGAPLAGVKVSLLLVGDTQTDADGRWELWVPPSTLRDPRFLRVRSPNHVDQTVEVFGEGGDQELVAAATPEAPEGRVWNRDVELVPTRPVTARCAGFPADRCDALLLACGPEGAPPISECTYGEPVVCECPTDPERRTVLTGGGQAVFVEPGSPAAWLDFRSVPGEVRGQVEGGGCFARLDRVGLAAVEVSSRGAPCAEDGSFRFEHVPPGEWEVRVLPRGGLVSPDRVRVERVVVADAVVDLGALPAVAGGTVPGP